MLVLVAEIMKIPSQKGKLLKAIEEPSQGNVDKAIAYQDAPVILQSMDKGNEKNQPFFLSLLVNNHLLHNCMLDSGASSNVMTKKVMEQLNLIISRPYHNICAMDSKKMEVCGLIKDLQVHSAVYPDIQLTMDIVVVDVPDAWGMLISRKTTVDFGGNIQMDLTYDTIPSLDGTMIRLNMELERRYHIEDRKHPRSEFKYKEDELGNYAILANFLEPIEGKFEKENLNEVWHMHFDGAHSRLRKGSGTVIQSPFGQVFKFAYRLEFDATNNVAEYEALLLGLEMCKGMGIKLLNIKRDSDLIVSQGKGQFACKSERLRRYRMQCETLWNSLKH